MCKIYQILPSSNFYLSPSMLFITFALPFYKYCGRINQRNFNMYNFFIEKNDVIDNGYKIQGTDYNHVKNVLRMKVGETLLISLDGKSHLCKIKEFTDQAVILSTIQENYIDTSLPIDICLLQGLPKSDKLELIIQKTVELGVSEIIPVEMARSIVKIDAKKSNTKTERYNAIAESAAKQSKRTVIPTVK